MPISGVNNYRHFVLPNDIHQTNAVASNFKPATFGNKVAVFFKQQENKPGLQKFGRLMENIRAKDLEARSSLNKLSAKVQKRFVNIGSAARMLHPKPNLEEIKTKHETKINNIEVKKEIKEQRLNLKKEINKAGSLEELRQRVSDSEKTLQDFLRSKGYDTPQKHLSDFSLPKYDAEYLSNAAGHKVRINYENLSFLQKKISGAKSHIHDHRLKGVAKHAANAPLHGMAGVSNAIHLIKQGVYEGAAKFATAGKEEHTTLKRKAAKERDMRRLNNAALSGNAKLADTFEKVNENRKESVSRTLGEQGYTETNRVIPGTDYTTRKINAYLSKGAPKPKIAKAAEIFIKMKNIKESVKANFYLNMGNVAKNIAHAAQNIAEKSEGVSKKMQYKNARGRFDAGFKKEAESAALKGELHQTVTQQRERYGDGRVETASAVTSIAYAGTSISLKHPDATKRDEELKAAHSHELGRFPHRLYTEEDFQLDAIKDVLASNWKKNNRKFNQQELNDAAEHELQTRKNLYSARCAAEETIDAKYGIHPKLTENELSTIGETIASHLSKEQMVALKEDILAVLKHSTTQTTEEFDKKYKNVFSESIKDPTVNRVFGKFAAFGLRSYKATGERSEFWPKEKATVNSGKSETVSADNATLEMRFAQLEAFVQSEASRYTQATSSRHEGSEVKTVLFDQAVAHLPSVFAQAAKP